MKKIYVKIDGIHCEHCKNKIKNELLKIKNIKNVEFDSFIACIDYENNIDTKKIIDKINNIDYFTKEEYISNNINDIKNNIKLKEFIIILLSIILILFILHKVFGFNIFNFIPTIDSSITYGMLFITGLLTSIHCISMCGAINLLVVTNYKRNFKNPIIYNLGRIISYTLLGGVIGFVGKIIQINSKVSGFIIIIASIIMFLMSLNMLGVINLKKYKFNFINVKIKNPFLIGLINCFMPCGPLEAMKLYALTTGSFIKGALSMFLFSLGTVSLMLFVGVLINLLKGKTKILINKISSVLILILSLIMLNRGFLFLNIDLFSSSNNYDNYTKSVINNNIQVVKIDLDYDNYEDIIVQKDIKVKLIIHVSKNKLTGCNNEIIIDKYNIKQKLTEGDNIIYFTPKEEGNILYTCWMNMIKNNIKVIDNIEYFKEG